MGENSLLIVGAGLSVEPCGFPVDKNFLSESNEGIKNAPQPFLNWALNRLYGNVISDQRSIFDETWDWQAQRLETVWSEIDANFNSPKFIINDAEIEAIKDELIKLAQSEIRDSKVFHYYYYYSFEGIRNLTPYEMLFLFAGWKLRGLILEIFGRKRFGSLNADHQTMYRILIDKIFRGATKKTVISFNYDVILDEAIEGRKYLGIKRINDEGLIDFIKPHGSINWYQEHDVRIRELQDPVSIEEIGFKEGRLYQHSIIPPVDRKREFTHEEFPGVVKQVYAYNLTGEVKQALLEADAITIIGYSFPVGDQHIRSIMTEVFRLRKSQGRPYNFVRYIDPEARLRQFTLENLFFSQQYDPVNKKWTEWIVET